MSEGNFIYIPDDQNSMLGGVFSFMRRTKKIRHNPESEGIYLDKLISEDIDPEVAALYFPNYRGMEISRSYVYYILQISNLLSRQG